MVSKYIGCKYLDYETNYDDCQIRTIEPEGWKYWERGERWMTYKGAPRNVQFCKLRGRINDIFSCINPNERPCYEVVEASNESI